MTPGAAKALAVLRDLDAPVARRVEAAKELGRQKEPAAIDALAAALDLTSEELRDAAKDALRTVDAAKWFIGALTSGTPEQRARAARALRHLKEPSSVPALAEALGAGQVEVRREAAHALAVFGAPAAKDALVVALADGASDVRYFAAIALRSVPAARAGLEARLKVEADAVVRSEIERSLGL